MGEQDWKEGNIMSKRIKYFLVFIILILFGFSIWYLALGLWNLFSDLQKEVAAAFIAAAATVIVSVVSVTLGKYYERKRLIEQELRGKKIPMYEQFVDFIFKLMMSEKLTGKQMLEKEMLNFFNSFTQKLMVWGSDEVVRQWSSYRLLLAKGEPPMDSMFELEKLLLAIRRDAGHKNNNIARGDLLGLFINDIDKFR